MTDDTPQKKKKLHAPASLASNINIAYMVSFIGCLVLSSLVVLIVLRVFIVSWANDDIKALLSKMEGSAVLNEQKIRSLSEVHPVSVLLADENRKTIFEINNLPSGARFPLSEKVFTLKYFDENTDGYEYRVYFETRTVEGRTYYLQICRDLSSENRVYSILASIIVYSCILTLIICTVIGFPVSSHLLRPITRMTESISDVTEKNLSSRIDTKKMKSELKALGEGINLTLDKLEKTYNNQSYFISDISHELRTPLSVISGYSDLLSRWGKDDPEVLEEAVAAIAVQTKVINDMLSKFSFLSKAESKGLYPLFHHFNLYELVNEVISDFSVLHPNLSFENFCPENSLLYADKALIRQLLVILFDNSCKYTSSGGKISVYALTEKKLVTISVGDTGIGIPEDELDKIFTRFYRVDKSRTKSTGGFGLGLAIAYQIVSAHGGEIHAESKAGEGTRMIIKIPQPF